MGYSIQWIAQLFVLILMRFIVIYPVNIAIQRLKTRGHGSQGIKLFFPQNLTNLGTGVCFECFFIFLVFNIRRESETEGMKPKL